MVVDVDRELAPSARQERAIVGMTGRDFRDGASLAIALMDVYDAVEDDAYVEPEGERGANENAARYEQLKYLTETGMYLEDRRAGPNGPMGPGCRGD